MKHETLKKLSENPWYILATVAGEPQFNLYPHSTRFPLVTGEMDTASFQIRKQIDSRNRKLVDKNKQLWLAALKLLFGSGGHTFREEFEKRLKIRMNDKYIYLEKMKRCLVPDKSPDICIDFSNTFFDRKHIDFSEYRFPFRVCMNDTYTHDDLKGSGSDFSGAIFEDKLEVRNAGFCSLASFERCEFKGDVSFDRYKRPNMSFVDARFCGDAHFRELLGGSQLNFSNATFKQTAQFSRSNLTFNYSSFTGTDKVPHTNELGAVWFQGTKFLSEARFDNVTFGALADFSCAKFTTVADFNNAKFPIRPPAFFDAECCENNIWTGIKLPPVQMPCHDCYSRNYLPGIDEAKAGVLSSFFNKPKPKSRQLDVEFEVEQRVSLYECLAQKMKAMGRPQEGHMFYRQEMRWRRLNESPLAKLVNFLYDYSCDFGYGMARAFTLWMGHILLGASLLFF